MSEKHSTRIKFCGLTRGEDAELAAELGVDFAGFIAVPSSPRRIDAADARAIAVRLPAAVRTVALFQNADVAEIAAWLAEFRPALLQFHGAETAAFCAQFGLPWIKAVPMGEPQRYADWERDYPTATALLVDSHRASGGGGSGHRFDWSALPEPHARRQPMMLAGGLNPETVAAAIAQVRPWGVDVSSGIEGATRGIKDHRKMRAFVAAVRAADEA